MSFIRNSSSSPGGGGEREGQPARHAADATGVTSPTHGIADGGELPVLLGAHVLAVAGFEGHPPTPPVNLKLCVDLPGEKSQLEKLVMLI